MGKNKLQKFAEMAAFSNVFQANFEQIKETCHPLKGNWRNQFFKNDNPIVVELGCGRGEYTVGLAADEPTKNYIGIDIKGARMHAGASLAVQQNMANVAFIRTRIEFVEAFFDRDEVDELWITFPDPQMKKPRKRLVGTAMLARYANILKTNGIIHLKTDSAFLYTYTMEMLKINNIAPIAFTNDLYTPNNKIPVPEIRTAYETKWIEHGLSIKYIKFQLPPDARLVEPEIEIEHDTYHSVGRGVKERT